MKVSDYVKDRPTACGMFESRPLEDMALFLPCEEVWKKMHQFDND